MKNILFLYHDPCTDGYLCRIVAEFFYTHAKQDVRVEYVGVNPSSLTADLDRILSGKVYDEILMFDVSLTPQNYNQLSAKAPIVKVFDHHESTAKAFANVETNWLTFDNNHCGAYLAFRYFYGNETPVPKLIQYVEVRDIWLYEKPRDLPESKEITTFLYNDLFRMPFKESREYFFLLFDSTNDWWCGAAKQGRIILNLVEKSVDSIVASMKEKTVLVNGVEKQCLVANAIEYVSEVGNKATKSNQSIDFALLWSYDTEGRIRISLRSDASRCNVNDVAKTLWNGGGHAAAAGALICDKAEQSKFLNFFSV